MFNVKLVECRYCGEIIAKEADVCPHCGVKSPYKTKHLMQQITKLLLCFFFIGSALWIGWPQISFYLTSQSTNSQKPVEFSASELWEVYQSDLEAAAAQYDEQPVLVTGKVIEISEFMRFPCLTLEADGSTYYSGYGGVICMFDSGDTKALNCKVGDTITVKGVCSGIDYGVTVWRDERYDVNTDFVWIKDCSE